MRAGWCCTKAGCNLRLSRWTAWTEIEREPWDDLRRRALRGRWPRVDTPLVPRNSISGRALVAVVAIMTFLASLTTGAVMLVSSAASDWQSDVGREVTIQVRPVAGRDIDADVRKAAEITRGVPGIADVRAYTQGAIGASCSSRGSATASIARRIAGAAPDRGQALRPARRPISRTAQALAAQVPGASLDDHRGWIDRMRAMAGHGGRRRRRRFSAWCSPPPCCRSLSRRAAPWRPTGRSSRCCISSARTTASSPASSSAISWCSGFKGGAIGGGVAIVLFGAVRGMSAWLAGTAAGDQATALFGTFAIGVAGYLAMVGQIILMAVVTALASRQTVNRTLESID